MVSDGQLACMAHQGTVYCIKRAGRLVRIWRVYQCSIESIPLLVACLFLALNGCTLMFLRLLLLRTHVVVLLKDCITSGWSGAVSVGLLVLLTGGRWRLDETINAATARDKALKRC